MTLPPCIFTYVPKNDAEPYADPNTSLSVPVYFSTSREELICEIRLPTKGQVDRWILSGTAVFLTE